eukprot:TRINITY_DN8316_c0_g1_i1.p1 TRINITY_DN8316_c0_g1~~TRINITY_DN8316_c0_g1_i1.p1  ORF type:complete len:160 (+),score=13.40 TRINITY_DN8316_c0_g1_i1:170-649(+)
MKSVVVLVVFLLSVTYIHAETHDILWNFSVGTIAMTIPPGDGIYWFWNDSMAHNVKNVFNFDGSTDPEFQPLFTNCDTLVADGDCDFTFTRLGTYLIQCTAHPANMRLTVTVTNDIPSLTSTISPSKMASNSKSNADGGSGSESTSAANSPSNFLMLFN